MTPRPLDEVLRHAIPDFTPEHPERPPWTQPTWRPVEVAATYNAVTVPLIAADRVQVHGIGRPTDLRDDLEPTDWTPAGWGVATP